MTKLASSYGREYFTRQARAGEKTTDLWLAIGKAGAINAALLAAAVLALGDEALAARLDAWRAAQTAKVADQPTDTP